MKAAEEKIARLEAELSASRQRTRRLKQQEIFRLKNELRDAGDGAVEAGTGALPDFVVIGAPKCGTTFLYYLLTKHPHVEAAACKEPGYFNTLFEEGVEWYRHCFPTPRQKDGRKTITGEATPSYMYQPYVPGRMAQVIPQARLIALLRNPVDRTYSAHYHRMRNGKETRTFEEAMEAVLKSKSGGHLSQAIYVEHLLRWSEFFGEEQMLVLKSEDFFDNPQEGLKRVLDFLDLPDWAPGSPELFDRRNKGGYEQKMDPALRRRLEDYFEPHNRRLYEHLGVDFGW